MGKRGAQWVKRKIAIFSVQFNKKLKVGFKGAQLTSDGELLGTLH